MNKNSQRYKDARQIMSEKLADSRKKSAAEKEERPKGINYFVTRRGMDWLGQHDGIIIHDEED